MHGMDVLDAIGAHESRGKALLFRVSHSVDPEESAEGCWVTGRSGRRYLDLGGYAVFLLGHRHPHVVQAVARQLGNMPCSSRALPNPIGAEAAAKLASVCPPPLEKVMFLGSGAEVVEAALKLARARTGRQAFCHAEGSYHGKSFGALSVTDGRHYKDRCGALLGPVGRLPKDDVERACAIVTDQRPAAVVLEPIQGEGGVHLLDPDWIRAVARTARDVGALVIADEIQSGLGRTGLLWESARSELVPDVILSGKALGGGVMPVSGLIATADAFAPFDRDPFLHTSTLGGSPLACAAAIAALEVITEQDVPRLAHERGEVFRALLESMTGAAPDLVREVRGRALLLGVECVDPTVAGFLLAGCIEHGLLVTPCTSRPATVRLSPPAFLGDAELEHFHRAFSSALTSCRRELEGMNWKPNTPCPTSSSASS